MQIDRADAKQPESHEFSHTETNVNRESTKTTTTTTIKLLAISKAQRMYPYAESKVPNVEDIMIVIIIKKKFSGRSSLCESTSKGRTNVAIG